MNFVCEKIKSCDSLIIHPCKTIGNINKIAKQFSLTIYFNDGKLRKSKHYGPEIFIIYKNGIIYAHSNPGKLAKLPTGVGKLKGCQYKMNDFIDYACKKECDLNTNWSAVEHKYKKGINIWRKTSGLNNSKIVNLRRSKVTPAIHLHCDTVFNKLFLVTCDKLYFRNHKHLIN